MSGPALRRSIVIPLSLTLALGITSIIKAFFTLPVLGCQASPHRDQGPVTARPVGRPALASLRRHPLGRTGGPWPIVGCMTVQPPPAGGPGLRQQRRLVTEIPGPASRELFARRESAVARGVSNIL